VKRGGREERRWRKRRWGTTTTNNNQGLANSIIMNSSNYFESIGVPVEILKYRTVCVCMCFERESVCL
jgi:hypothetical protein